jgi:hypothetical protein
LAAALCPMYDGEFLLVAKLMQKIRETSSARHLDGSYTMTLVCYNLTRFVS